MTGVVPKGQRVGTIYDKYEECLDVIRISREVREVLTQIEEHRHRYGEEAPMLKIEAALTKVWSDIFEYTSTLGR